MRTGQSEVVQEVLVDLKTDTDCQESGHKNTNASAEILINDTKIILIA